MHHRDPNPPRHRHDRRDPLRGRILPIGGLKEKLLAALRGGLKKLLIPEENAKDLVDIPDSVKNALEIVPVARMDEVLQPR